MARSDSYMLGEITSGKLYVDNVQHKNLASALEAEKRRGYRSGHVILRYRNAKKYGVTYGLEVAYFSALDGAPIPERNVQGLLR